MRGKAGRKLEGLETESGDFKTGTLNGEKKRSTIFREGGARKELKRAK